MDKLDIAIERLKIGSEASLKRDGRPLVLTYSGGKDSDVCLEIAYISGIPFEVVHSHTTADAPETVRHVRAKFYGLESMGVLCSISYPKYKGVRTSMWDLIVKKKWPPFRSQRYCCEVLKESTMSDRYIITGVRWAESLKRKSNRGIAEYGGSKGNISENLMVTNDNDLARRIMEFCQIRGQMIFNPIVDWTNEEVWDFLHDRKVQLNPLYTCSKDRVGCVGCPMAGKRRYIEFRKWPAYKKMYIHTFDRMLEARRAAGLETKLGFKTGYDVFRWWMEDNIDQMQFDWYESADNIG